MCLDVNLVTLFAQTDSFMCVIRCFFFFLITFLACVTAHNSFEWSVETTLEPSNSVAFMCICCLRLASSDIYSYPLSSCPFFECHWMSTEVRFHLLVCLRWEGLACEKRYLIRTVRSFSHVYFKEIMDKLSVSQFKFVFVLSNTKGSIDFIIKAMQYFKMHSFENVC